MSYEPAIEELVKPIYTGKWERASQEAIGLAHDTQTLPVER